MKGALKAMPIKTDRRDAEGIARLLHLVWFRPVHCKSVSAQEVRAVLNARKAVQQGFIALEMSLRRALAELRPQGRDHIAGQVRAAHSRTNVWQPDADRGD